MRRGVRSRLEHGFQRRLPGALRRYRRTGAMATTARSTACPAARTRRGSAASWCRRRKATPPRAAADGPCEAAWRHGVASGPRSPTCPIPDAAFGLIRATRRARSSPGKRSAPGAAGRRDRVGRRTFMGRLLDIGHGRHSGLTDRPVPDAAFGLIRATRRIRRSPGKRSAPGTAGRRDRVGRRTLIRSPPDIGRGGHSGLTDRPVPDAASGLIRATRRASRSPGKRSAPGAAGRRDHVGRRTFMGRPLDGGRGGHPD